MAPSPTASAAAASRRTTAINTVIQGSAADIIKLAMLNISRRLRRENRRGRMLLQIHDELVFEVPPDELEDVTQLVIEEMRRSRRPVRPLGRGYKNRQKLDGV